MAFKPGVSGNPNGRPRKKKTLTDVLDKYLREKEGELSRRTILASRLWELTEYAIDPDTRLSAIKYIYDRADGKPVESTQVSGPGGAPIGLQVFDHRSVLASLAPGSTDDHQAPSPDESAGDGETLG